MRILVSLALVLLAATACASHAHRTAFAVGMPSPDGRWSVVYSKRATVQGTYGRLDFIDRRSGRRLRMYRSNDSCCHSIRWIAPHLLIFDDDYRVETLDPATRRLHQIADFSNFVVSHDGRLVAGYAFSPHEAETVAVVPVAGGRCRGVPRRPGDDDTVVGFTRDDGALVLRRRRFDLSLRGDVGKARTVTVPLTALRPLQPLQTCQ